MQTPNPTAMDSKDFTDKITGMIRLYLENADSFDSNPQLRVEPETLQATIVNGSDMLAEIDNSDENVEAAAAAQGMESQADTDYQASRNPDFYPVSTLISKRCGKTAPCKKAITELVAAYFKH